MRWTFAPLHPDGFKFVAAGVVVSVLLFLMWSPAGWLGMMLTIWIAYFFRDPWRVTPRREGLLISPADGTVVSVAPALPPPELEMGEDPVLRIGMFLSIFDVHVTRAPVDGRVAALRYSTGRFLDARREEASRQNERMAIRLAPPSGPEIAFVLVAGRIARRIVCDLREGQDVSAGRRMGIIRLGSRVEVYCPPPYVPMVIEGQRMVGGETVIADRLAQEPPREGVAQ